MATKTQFLPYAHRYQDPTVGLREALHGIQTGMVQRGELRVREADQKLRQGEMDRHAEKRSFLASYQPTLSEDHLTNDGLERYNSLIEHNQDRLSAMGDDERESVRQKVLRETADAGRVARTVREDIMRSGIFDPADVDVLATSYGSGYTDFAAESKTAYDADVERAKGRASVFKDAAAGLGYAFGSGKSGTSTGTGAALTDSDTQMLLAAGAPDPKTGLRPGFPQKYNNQNNPLLQRYNDIFQDDPKKDRYIDLLENRGLVTYQKNALTPEFIDNLVKVATADNSMGWYDNPKIRQNVEAGARAYYHNLNETAADGDGRVAAPPPEVLLQVLFDGVKKGGFLSDHKNTNADTFLASAGAAEIGALFEKAHDKYLEDSEKELEALLKRMAEQNFDFYGTKFPELNQRFYREKPALTQQDIRTYLGRTETGGAYAAPTQAAQQPSAQQQQQQQLFAVTQGLNAQGQPITPAQQLEQLGQVINLPADVKEEHFGGLERFPSPEAFTAVMLPMAEEAAARIGVSPQHILVQAALETGWGKKPVVSVDGKPTYNLFGIKAYGNWNGPSALVNTTEVENGKEVPKQEPFRVYNSFAESFVDYVNFLQQNPRYSKALEAGATGDGPAFLNAIADAGYATGNKYKEKLQDVLRSVERRIPEGYTPGNFVSSPAMQQYINTQGAGIQPQQQQQGHPATEHLRALLDTYPQPYTEKSFTYDKVDAAFRRLGLTVPAAERVQADLTPVAAGVGSFPHIQVGAPAAPAAPAVQPAPAVTEAAPASGKEAPLTFAEQQKFANSEADTKFQAWLESTLGGKPYPETLEDVRRRKAEREKLLQYYAEEPVTGNLSDIFWKAGPGEASWGPFTFRHLPNDRNRGRTNPTGQDVGGVKWPEMMERLFPSAADAIGVRGDMGLVYDPNSAPYTATEQAERIARGDMLLGGPGYRPQAATRAGQTPQTPQASTGRTAPPLRPPIPQVEAKSLPVQREENSNNFLMLRQDRQQELRDLIDSRTNQGISKNQQPEQEAAEETAGASERYQMLADIIREFQQGVGSNRRMTLGNIA